MRALPLALFVSAFTLAASTARADAPRFGDEGTTTAAGSITFGAGTTTTAVAQDVRIEEKFQSLSASGTLDTFLVPRLSLGVGLAASWSHDASTILADPHQVAGYVLPPAHGTILQGVVRLGYAIPLGSRVSFWPLAYGGYAVERASIEGEIHDATAHSLVFGAEAQLLFHVTPHAFARLAPGVATFTSSRIADDFGYQRFTTSIAFGFGFWW